MHDGAARLNVVPRPGAPQSELRIGHVAVARSTPDYHPLVTANTILGGQFVSRINLNLREDKGFTYGARTEFDFRLMPGPFSVQVSVQTAATARAIERVDRRNRRNPRPAACDRGRTVDGGRHPDEGLRSLFRNPRNRSRAPSPSSRCTTCPTTTSPNSCRESNRSLFPT